MQSQQKQNSNACELVVSKMTLNSESGGHSRGGGGSGGGPGAFGRRCPVLRYSICLALFILVVGANLAEGQFFTKSSKSIPRMGRRSLPDYKSELEAYQQLLAEEYEQNLINDALERQQKTAAMVAADDGVSAADAAAAEQAPLDRNQNLSDLLKLRALGERVVEQRPTRDQDEFDAAQPKAMTRNERARPQLFGDLRAAAAAAAVAAAAQQQQREVAAARLESTRERAW